MATRLTITLLLLIRSFRTWLRAWLRTTLERTLRAALGAGLLSLLIHVSECLVESLGILVDISDILTLHSFLKACDIRLHIRLDVSRDLIAILLQELLSLEAESVSVVVLVDSLLLGLIGSLISLGLVTHPLDLLVRKT